MQNQIWRPAGWGVGGAVAMPNQQQLHSSEKDFNKQSMGVLRLSWEHGKYAIHSFAACVRYIIHRITGDASQLDDPCPAGWRMMVLSYQVIRQLGY